MNMTDAQRVTRPFGEWRRIEATAELAERDA